MSTATLQHNKEVVQAWIDEVFNAKNMEAIPELKVSSYLDWTPFPTQRLDLPISGLKESLPAFLESLPDFQFETRKMLAEGDLVVCLGEWQATHRGAFMGVPPTGNRIGGTRIDIFRVTGDKMAEHWGCGNEMAFLELLQAIQPLEPVPETDPAQVARRFVDEVMNKRNLAALKQLLHPHAIDHAQQALNTFVLLSAFPDLRLTIDEVTTDEEQVAVRSQFEGTHQGRFMGIPPTGKTVTGTRKDLFRIEEGQIVEAWQDWDRTHLVEQLKE